MAELNKKQLFEAMAQAADQNLLTKVEIKAIIEEVVKKAFHSKFDPDADLELIIDEDTHRFELINNSKFVVEDEEAEVEYRAIDIPLSEALKINANVKVGDTIREAVDFAAYSSNIAQQIRQMFTQSVREKKKEAIFAKHKGLKGEMIEVTVLSVASTFAIFKLEDGTTAFMPQKLRNPNIPLSVGQRTKVFVEDVLQESKDSQILVSNGSKDVIKRILEEQVPEIASGVVEIVKISRIPGERSKVAVKSNQAEVDAVGAIIGSGGQRMRSIVGLLQGEKLDIIQWVEDKNIFIANALSPAKIAGVINKTDANGEILEGNVIAIAPNKHQTLAIGKRGSNVRLAVELTNTRIDVVSIDQANEKGLVNPFNTGITQADIDSIEAGENFRKRPNFTQQPSFDNTEFDATIDSFASEIEEQEVKTNQFDEIENDLFSEEDLAKMEADFEFDEELAEYQEDDENEETQEI